MMSDPVLPVKSNPLSVQIHLNRNSPQGLFYRVQNSQVFFGDLNPWLLMQILVYRRWIIFPLCELFSSGPYIAGIASE